MATVARLIGGAGTGKTRALLDLMSKAVEEIGDPLDVGFVSFTRAARREAAERASLQFDLTPRQLEQDGWFRTLHSVCYQCLGLKSGDLLTDDAAGREWIQEHLQEDVSGVGSDPHGEPFREAACDADKALLMWSAARNRLQPLREAWELCDAADSRTPPYQYVRRIVEQYEQAKRLDHRLDYTDLLLRFAGYNAQVDAVTRAGDPSGRIPRVSVWFFDEQQDASALLDAVCKRLVSSEDCRWAYVVGDPFQSIYGWAGADPAYFMGWEVAKQRTMPKSYRCPPPVLALGERILAKCSDYWDRGIQPADREGRVDDCPLGEEFVSQVNPAEPWLLLARTNFLARRLGATLDRAGVPWKPSKGLGGWHAPVRNEAIRALYSLEQGAPIDGAQWQSVLKHIPSTLDGSPLLVRGTKAQWDEYAREEAEDKAPWVHLEGTAELGATEHLQAFIRTRRWRGCIEKASDYILAITRYGADALADPQVEIGTIHSAKGRECENVAVLTTLPEVCYRGAQTQTGYNEEQRTFYVAATRAKHRLLIVDEVNPQYRKSLPLYDAAKPAFSPY